MLPFMSISSSRVKPGPLICTMAMAGLGYTWYTEALSVDMTGTDVGFSSVSTFELLNTELMCWLVFWAFTKSFHDMKQDQGASDARHWSGSGIGPFSDMAINFSPLTRLYNMSNE